MNTAIFTACYLASSFLAAAPAVEQQDWLSRDGKVFIAFRPTTSDQVGEVWYMRWQGLFGGEAPFFARTGTYSYVKPDVVRMTLTRQWNACFAERPSMWWANARDYDPAGNDPPCAVDFKIELSSNEAVLSTISINAIDSNGKPIAGKSARTRFREFTVGDVVTFTASDGFEAVKELPPPGYEPRSGWERSSRDPDLFGGANYFDKDWYGWSYTDLSKPDSQTTGMFTLLSLRNRKGGEWDAGTAWLVTMSDKQHTAMQGEFQVDITKAASEDIALLKFTVSKTYTSRPGEPDWQFSPKSDKYLLTIDIPLENFGIPMKTPSAALMDIQFVDDSGLVIVKSETPVGGGAPVPIRPRTAYPFSRGHSFYFRVGAPLDAFPKMARRETDYLTLFKASSPPGFERESATTITTRKPAANAKPADLANAHLEAGKYKDAITAFSQAITQEPENAEHYVGRGDAHYALKDYATALKDYSQAITRDPKLAQAYYNRARAFGRLKEYEKQVTDLENARRLLPESAAVLNALAWLLATCPDNGVRDGNKSFEYARKACDLTNWLNGACLDTLAAAKAEAGDFAGAVKTQDVANSLLDGSERRAGEARRAAYQAGKPTRGE